MNEEDLKLPKDNHPIFYGCFDWHRFAFKYFKQANESKDKHCKYCQYFVLYRVLFIGPESDHWLCLSLTHSLTNSCLVNLTDVTLACEDGNSKLVEVVIVANFDDEDRVGNSLLQIWELRFGHKAKLLFIYFEHKVW